ncbi:MAG: hypothetical protein NZ952_06840 [Candidatus Bathyarchaeota archaeon]|nr:hypothetical protein [Candidatus Bathyarchaeota archaeon]
MTTIENTYDFSNIQYCTPTWDVDSILSNWQVTIRTAKEIINILESFGVRKSLYIKWSGNGCHIHLHERSLSPSILEHHHPFDLAFSIVEYVKAKLTAKISEYSPKDEIRVENKMDLARVFTCPLSLHRKLDVSCICMKPNQLDEFTPEWLAPDRFRHNLTWREFIEGEADELAESAYSAIGGYQLLSRRRKRKTMPLDRQIIKWLFKDHA